MAETDAVLNDETRRALRRRVRQIGMLVVGAIVTIVIFGAAALAAILSLSWQLSLALTVGVTVAIPVAVPYAMLRVLGLSHRDVTYVGKRAYREAVAEVIALSGTRQTADVFAESETTESVGNPSITTDGGESETENRSADEAAESATETRVDNPQNP